MEELEQAMKKYNMGDDKSIKEIIAEVDTDRVCLYVIFIWFGLFIYGHYHFVFLTTLFTLNSNLAGRKNQLRRIRGDDEERTSRVGDKPTQSQYVKRRWRCNNNHNESLSPCCLTRDLLMFGLFVFAFFLT